MQEDNMEAVVSDKKDKDIKEYVYVKRLKKKTTITTKHAIYCISFIYFLLTTQHINLIMLCLYNNYTFSTVRVSFVELNNYYLVLATLNQHTINTKLFTKAGYYFLFGIVLLHYNGTETETMFCSEGGYACKQRNKTQGHWKHHFNIDTKDNQPSQLYYFTLNRLCTSEVY